MEKDKRSELVVGLIKSLPNKPLYNNPSGLIVENEETGRYIVLKVRPGHEDVPLEDYERYNKRYGWDYPYHELLGESIIIGVDMLTKRGKDLAEYI